MAWSIYFQASLVYRPHLVHQLVSYNEYPFFGWYTYDKAFRTLITNNPKARWDVSNISLYNMHRKYFLYYLAEISTKPVQRSDIYIPRKAKLLNEVIFICTYLLMEEHQEYVFIQTTRKHSCSQEIHIVIWPTF